METRRMCPHCRAFITTRDRVCPYCNETVGPRAVEREGGGGGFLGSFVPHAHFVTVMILLINFALYAATTIYSMRSGNESAVWGIDGNTLISFGGSFREAVFFYGQWWRLITAGFLHGGLIHILMNSWVLFDVGAQVEEIYGASRLVVFYLVATVCGFFASGMWSSTLSVGASAGLFGLIGAMIALGVTHKSAMGDAIRGLYVRWAIYGLLIGLLPGLHIDNAAHIGGLAGGFVVAFAAGLPGRTRGLGERFWRVSAGVCVAVAAFSFLRMYLWFAAAR